MTMTKRTFLGAAGAALGAGLVGFFGSRPDESAAAERFEIARSPDEWRRILSPAQYRVLREQGTERAGSSPLNKEHRRGIFACAGCGLPVFSSEDKYESGTGWPSFTRAITRNVGTRDRSFFMVRTEVHCRRCGGHLGHVFGDGPPPTGKRWCINGVALRFAAA